MLILYSVLGVTGFVLLTAYICFRMTFYDSRKQVSTEEYPLPVGEIYQPYREKMIGWIKENRQMPYEKMEITSFDGLALRGRFYECHPGAPIELMFPGYRGNAERDLCGGVQRCFKLGHSALIVDQRACGESEGHVITFGVYESRDCVTWVDFMLKRFGPDVKIILTGISMGAATVLMAAAEPMPENVIGVLADCGFTGAKEIIQTVIRQMKLPAPLLYPFVKLGAWLYGNFSLEENSPVEALKKCTLPVLFFHGEGDDFVPCEMSRRNFEACASSKKQLVTVPGAGHGLSYPEAPETYLQTMREFWP